MLKSDRFAIMGELGRYMKSAHSFLVSIFAATLHMNAEGEPAPVYVMGTGNLSCGAWVEARGSSNKAQTDLMVQWSAGYLSGRNYYLYKTATQISAGDLPTISLWHDTYCRNNPIHNLFFSSSAFIEELGGEKALHSWKR